MKKHRGIVWFRQDLRLHDNEALTDALRCVEEVIPVYIFDERLFRGKTRFDFARTGKYRAKFIIESVEDLRRNLRRHGSELIVRVGKPEEILFDLAREAKSTWVFCNRERTPDEIRVQDALERKLWSIGQEVRFSRGKMLYYTQDLPFPVTHTPDIFTSFRKEVEKIVPVRKPLPVPEDFGMYTMEIEPGDIPVLLDFGLEDFVPDERAVIQFTGGETAGLRRLHYYIWESEQLLCYKETRDSLLGGDFSSKFSTWLSQGCLSPKMIYHEIKRFESERKSNKSTYWLFFELLWRDFFRLMGKKHENNIFLKGGTKQQANPSLTDNYDLLNLWIEGRTGLPFIDANMRELAHTGYMSNRGRQNVASFLIKDLGVNWQMGAAYFESLLIDYDPCSNYGNWNYIAGVGSDPREDRYFNILSQAKRYDPKGAYIKHWLPELKSVSDMKIHQPDTLTEAEQHASKVMIGADYPKAMIDPSRWS